MSAKAIDISTTVGELVTERPSRARVFEQLGIDYCCGGKRPLSEVCREKNLDPQTVVNVLLATEQAVIPSDSLFDPAAMTLTELADHIEQTHHAYLRRELPRLGKMITKCVNAHGDRHKWLQDLRSTYTMFVTDLYSHMAKEEQILFPMVRTIDEAETAQAYHGGSLQNPIKVMELEHDHAGDALATMRRLTSDYTPPGDACNTFRALLDGLHELEQDMHQHVHKENNVMFPRAIEREMELLGDADRMA